ncbi:MAG: DUF2158 domain-containing protein [Bacteroidetes bacterium]|nr:DUF2158 domain-containing protein [Bacteroidota bacterium]
MPEDEIKEGDVVQLKSGSLKMTVGAFENRPAYGKIAVCYFAETSQEIKSMQIYVAALKKVQ